MPPRWRGRAAPPNAAFLDLRSPTGVASVSKFLGNPAVHEPYRHLAEIVRSGSTSLPGEGAAEPENPVRVEFARSMAPMTAARVPRVAAIVLDGLRGPLRVLDLAAGHGRYGIAIAKQHPQARIAAFDNAQKAGVGHRDETIPGSAFEAEYGGPYDAALLTNFLHHFDRAICVGLRRKVHAALRFGGRAAALEFVPNQDRVSPPMAAGFALTMRVTTRTGDAYTFFELESMCR